MKLRPLSLTGVLTCAALLVLLRPSDSAHARPAHKRALADFFGPDLSARLNDCRTCHLPDKPGADEHDKPHNPFGARLKAVRAELRKAGKSTDIETRLQTIADEDSDGDGVSNFLELLSGHAPGDPADKPSAAEIADARKKLIGLRARHRDAYAWRPFAPVVRPPVPVVKRPGWQHNPIDAFLAAEHERNGLEPRPPARKAVLLRRVYLDLIGLPPTRAELHAFLEDTASNAYEKVVERLLASPQYGERWGRHWMDVWRYSDWYGFGAEVRNSQKHIWHWRDWIVEALNADKGYDRMVQEMLAGDELAPDDPDTLRATGFLVRSWYRFNRNVWLDNIVEHTGKAFLGITLNCARCHEHKFDPIAHEEYYSFRAIFEPHLVRTDRLPGFPSIELEGIPHVYDGQAATPTYRFERGNEARPDKAHPLPPRVPAFLGGTLTIQPVKLPLFATAPDRRPFVIAETLAASASEVDRSHKVARQAHTVAVAAVAGVGLGLPLDLVGRAAAVERSLRQRAITLEDEALASVRHKALIAVLKVEKLEDDGQRNTPAWMQAATATVQAQRQQALAEAHLAVARARLEIFLAPAANRAAATRKLADAMASVTRAEKASREPTTTAYTPRPQTVYPAVSTGRRLALARWITDRKNPLAARVAVNHIWMRHFGRALVPSEFDFGRNGQAPTHPALLDYLAIEFMERGWSMKQIHRLIVTSAAYRMDTHDSSSNRARDRDNRFLWRMTPRRMEAEVVRDSLLAVAGQLERARGGPDLDHNLGLTVRRRSLYFRHAAEKQMELLTLFDAASVTECYRRSESIIPQQALALVNSPLTLSQSRLLARSLTQETGPGNNAAFVRAGFEQVLSRPPTEQEQQVCLTFLAEQTARLTHRGKLTPLTPAPPAAVPPATDPAQRARESLILVLLNHNDFVTIR